MEKEESIDLGRLWQIMLEQKKIVGSIIAGCTLLAIIISLILPKQWESTTLVQMRSAGGASALSGAASMAAAMGISIGGNSVASPFDYIELMKSRTVLQPIIDSMEWEDEKDKPEPEKFAKKYLDIQNTKQTNLITVKAKGRTPEEAQMISQAVVDNFLTMQTDMNQQTQSLLVTFLNGRIETARKEADEAAQKLAVYSREHRIYSPNDQAKAAIEQLSAYDKAISDMQVQQKSAQAQYDVATQKLGEQKSGAKGYNINDNRTVQDIRSQIVTQEVELVGLRQKYTDNHPNVIAAQEKLSQLNQALTNEVSAIVNSNAASINTAQMSIMTNQAVAQAQARAAKDSEAALKNKKDEKQKEIDNLPDEVMNYVQLDSDAKIKMQVYTTLVQQCEQNKIQEAMESMDIQVVDSANLPEEDEPSFPKRVLFLVVGCLIGCAFSMIYVSQIYYRRGA